MSEPAILIHLDGGLIQGVFTLRKNGAFVATAATVHDYDVDDVDEDRYPIKTDSSGRDYVEYEV